MEKIGVDRAREMAQKADLILYVVDSSVPLDENDEEIMEMLTGKKAIILYNKTDLQPEIQPEILKEKNRTSCNSDFCKRRKRHYRTGRTD